jgi:hypothetical protein
VSGYVLAPLSQTDNGSVMVLDFSANLNLSGVAEQVNTVNAKASSRISHHWLDSRQAWIYGVNAGVDTRPAYWQYAFQAGLGAEALSRSMEFRLNGYIPFAHTNELYATGWTDVTLTADAKDAVTQAECNFLDLRGLPVVREGDVRLDSVQVTVPDALAINPATGQPWVVRCTETTSSSYSVTCANASLDAMLAAAGAGDVLLAGGGASADLSTRLPASGQPTLQLAPGTQLGASGNTAALPTQCGPASVSTFNFTKTSITNYSTSNV